MTIAIRLLDSLVKTEGFNSLPECNDARRNAKVVIGTRLGFFDDVTHDLRDLLK